jgi:hypothetical protein
MAHNALVVVLRSENQKSVEAGAPTVQWTVTNQSTTTWEAATLTLFSKSDNVQAPLEIAVPLLAPHQTVELGTQILVTEGSAELAYLLEVWSGEEGAMARLDAAMAVTAPKPELSAKVVYMENASDMTALQPKDMLDTGVQQVVGVLACEGTVQAIIRNDGKEAWPAGTALELVQGHVATERIEFHAVQPGEMIHVALEAISGDSRWVLATPDGRVFGALIQVLDDEKEAAAKEPSPSESTEAQAPSEGWEKVEEPEEAQGHDLADPAVALALGCTVLREMGHEDDVMNAFLLEKYDFDLCKVCTILQGKA